MKNKIKISWSVLLGMPLLMTFSGCQKFLDRKPLDATLEDIPGGGLEGQALGLYSEIRGIHYDGFNTIPWLAFHSFRDDDSQKGSSAGDGSDWGAIFDGFSYTKNHWSAEQYWKDHYAFLGNINKTIDIGDSLNQSDERSVINMGEAKFFRAYVFFDLVRVYGQVPLINFRANSTEEANIIKSSEADIYAQIDTDLDAAAAALPVSWEGKYPGRLTQGAALTLHAKTYLYRQRWADALALCSQVMSSGQYSLYNSYEGIFRESGENSSESIFEIQATKSAGDNGIGALNNFAGSQGTRGAGDWNLGWGWNTPTDQLANHTYEPGDPRREATILFSGQPDGLYGNVLPPYDPNNFPQLYWNKKVYTDPTIRASTGDLTGPWVNHRILRYADVILMAAEASNELGDTAKARELVNQVRTRARGTTTALPDIQAAVSQENMRNLIIQERHAEFAMEGERFFDLVRWDIADSVLAPLGYTHKNRYYPLPQFAVDASHGVLVQNPDY